MLSSLSPKALLDSENPAQVLADYYATCSDEQVATAYSNVAKGLAVFEETPRGELGLALRRHLNVIVAEQQKRGEVHHA
ncbi:hypothetical protein HER32_11855 [Hymenobacter sp. BT18]|uniref:hypothetical protein n=1 Tax=Hymenobacter sp. BT18 TaxID=2835648 RepID=UPI00143E9419|nr:hypothetical protein [Hymenobacter sp. BT18]QIX61836.1 hypothetical protein HER32_11855 [Hymenobacter sp. BT18]